MPQASFRHRVATSATPDDVWHRLQDPAVWADVAGVDRTSDHRHSDGRLEGFRFTADVAGVAYRGRAEVGACRPLESMTIAIRSNELTGSISVEIVASGSETALDVTMRMQPAGIVGSMVFPLVSSAVESGFPGAVERFGDQMA